MSEIKIDQWDRDQKPFISEGAKAYLNGLTIEDCPYDEHDDRWTGWTNGFITEGTYWEKKEGIR